MPLLEMVGRVGALVISKLPFSFSSSVFGLFITRCHVIALFTPLVPSLKIEKELARLVEGRFVNPQYLL